MTGPPIAGIITPPGWCDPTPAEFQGLCATPVRIQQALVDVPELDYDDLDAIAAAEPEVARAARLLGLTGATVLGMTGTPFVWAGLSDEARARERVERIAQAAGCPVVMAGTAVIDALRALGVRKIAVATPYYTRPWRSHAGRILTSAGFDVLAIRSADEQGLAPSIRSIDDHSSASAPELLRGALRDLDAAEPGAEAFVCLGAGVRTLALTPGMEAELGRPVVASDTALYWALAQELKLDLHGGALGRLEAAL